MPQRRQCGTDGGKSCRITEASVKFAEKQVHQLAEFFCCLLLLSLKTNRRQIKVCAWLLSDSIESCLLWRTSINFTSTLRLNPKLHFWRVLKLWWLDLRENDKYLWLFCPEPWFSVTMETDLQMKRISGHFHMTKIVENLELLTKTLT